MLQSAAMRGGGDDPTGLSLCLDGVSDRHHGRRSAGWAALRAQLMMMLTASAGLMGVALFGMMVSQHLPENPTLSPGDGTIIAGTSWCRYATLG